jgi:hypothetical protein
MAWQGQMYKNRGIQGSMDSWPFRLIRPWFACKAKSTPVPKMIQSSAMLKPRLLWTLIGCLRLCRGVVRPKVQKSGHSGINGFPAISTDSSLVRKQDKINTCSKDDPVQRNAQTSAFMDFDPMLALVPRRCKAQGTKVRAFRNQWIPSHFG